MKNASATLHSLTNIRRSLYTMCMLQVSFWSSYVMIIASLALFFINHLRLGEDHSYLLFGVFSAPMLGLPIIGGYLADRFLGFKRIYVIGLIALAIGGLGLGYATHTFGVYASLASTVVGYCIALPCSYGLLSSVFVNAEDQRTKSFMVVYAFVNIGIVLGVGVGGYLIRLWGYAGVHYVSGFLAIIALVIFAFRHKCFSSGDKFHFSAAKYVMSLCVLLIMYSLCVVFFYYAHIANIVFIVVGISAIAWFAYFLRRHSGKQRLHLIIFLFILISSIAYWVFYTSYGSVIEVFLNNNIRHNLFGLNMPVISLLMFYAVFVVIFSILLRGYMQHRQSIKHPSWVLVNVSIGTSLLGVGFCVLALACAFFAFNGYIAIYWFLFYCLCLGLSDAFINPVVLSMIGLFSAPGEEGFLQGVWQFYLGMIQALSAFVAIYTTKGMSNIAVERIPIYAKKFFSYGVILLVVALLTYSLLKLCLFKRKG